MISLNDCITEESRITFIKLKYCCQAYDINEKEVYFKSFSINEFIGQRLASIRKLRSNKYFLVLPGEDVGVYKYGDLNLENAQDIKIGSYNFQRNGYDYDFIYEYGFGPDCMEDILDLCPNNENRNELLHEILELFALDIFMEQDDRSEENLMFEKDKLGNIHLAPIFDYELSLEYNADLGAYLNPIHCFIIQDHYREFFYKYPEFYDMLETYLDVDLMKEVKKAFQFKKLDYRNVDLSCYKIFEEKKKEQLGKILR